METFPSFRKLWGRIEIDIGPGMYSVDIINSKIYKRFLFLN